MLKNLDGLMWLLLFGGALLLLQRRLHSEVQAILLVITRRDDIALTLFSVLFFPGILLHEGSHFLMARLLGVRTGRFSLLPRPLPGGKLRLGYVETAKTDWVRDTLIGIAPLLIGGVFVAYAGLARLGFLALGESLVSRGMMAALDALRNLDAQPDFWLWFYLAMVVSSTMLPSASDRRSWLPLGIMAILLLGLAIMSGIGPWLLASLAEPFNQVMQAVAIVFGISALLHLIFLLPLWILRYFLCWLLGVQIQRLR